MFLLRFFSRTVEFASVSVLFAGLPLSPVAVMLISGTRGHLKNYQSTVRRCAAMVPALWHSHVIARNIERVLSPKAHQPGRAIQGSCTHCGRCCVDRKCVFLSWTPDGQSHCGIYKNWFWKMTSCGDYPVDGHSIDVYACPSFKSIPVKVVSV